MSFTVRKVRPGEEAAFRAIRLRALTESPSAFASTAAETETRPAQYWQDRIRSAVAGQESILFIAEDGREWAGLVGGSVYEEASNPVPYLISMWVDPAQRGRGIGRALVTKVIEWAHERGFAQMVLEVEASNYPAISLYARCGFRPTGEVRPHPTYPGLQEIMMKRSLDQP